MKVYALQGTAFALRSASLLGRFLLTVVAARALPPESFGFFMLYTAALQLGTGAAAMDAYAETTRLVLDTPDQRQHILSRHFSFLSAAGAIFGPFAALAFFLYEGNFALLLYLIFPLFFMTELFANDITRLLPPLQHPFAASVFLFVRQMLPLATILAMEELAEGGVTLLEVIVITFGSTSLLIGVTMILLRFQGHYETLLRLDIRWLHTTLQASLMFFAGTLVFRALFGIDRFIVASMTDLETSGIYALYISFGLGIVSILEAGVSAWKYPQLVDALLKRNSRSVVIQLKSFLATNFISSVVLCLCAYAAIQYIVLNFLEPFYNAGLVHLHWILFGAVALSVSLPFHYLLYGLRKDWSFLVIYIFALAAVISYAFLILKDGDVGKVFGLFAIAAFFIAAGRLTFAIGPLKAIYKGSWP